MPFPYDLLVPIALATLAVIALIALSAYLHSPARRGKQGEKTVSRVLRRNLLPGDCLIDDLYLADPDDRTRSTQIDHILVSTRGLFVIETKNLSQNYVEQGDEWFPVLRDGTLGDPIYSPVRQNLGHIRTVKRMTGARCYAVNLVVFVQGKPKDVHAPEVCSPEGLPARLVPAHPLSQAERDRVARILLQYKEHPPVGRREHIRNVRRRRRS